MGMSGAGGGVGGRRGDLVGAKTTVLLQGKLSSKVGVARDFFPDHYIAPPGKKRSDRLVAKVVPLPRSPRPRPGKATHSRNATVVLRLFYGCSTVVLRLFYGCSTNLHR